MKLTKHRHIRRADLQLCFCIALLAGIGSAHAGFRLPSAIAAIGAACLWLFVRNYKLLSVIGVLLLGLWLGSVRGEIFARHLHDYQQLEGQKITLRMRALDNATYGTNGQLGFSGDDVQMANGQKLLGVMHVSGFALNAVFQGDELQVTGKLRAGSGHYQGYISYAKLVLIQHHPTIIASVRRNFAAGMQTALPEPGASFGLGLLIGQRTTLPLEIKQDILVVGLTHIIAVSGYNLTIMLHASRRLLSKHSKRLSTLLSVSLIALFLLLTGSSASIVRAAIVSLLSIWVTYYGRSFRPINIILLTAAVTAWANPFYVWSDISWYLSFLAFYGVLVIAPLVASGFHRAWQRSILATIALESLCAELMTLPFILFTFGQLSLIGLLANVLVVALIPLAMLFSVIAGLAGMLAASVSGWLAWPANWLLTYMLDTAHILAQIPGVFRQQIGLPLWQMLSLYGLILALMFVLMHRKSRLRDRITDKNLQGALIERSQQMVNN